MSPKKYISFAEQLKICELYHFGLNTQQIAKKFGLNRSSVRKILLKNDVEIRPRKLPLEEKKKRTAEYQKTYRENNKARIAAQRKQYVPKSPTEAQKKKYAATRKQYKEQNKQKVSEYNKKYLQQYYQKNRSNLAFKLRLNISASIGHALKKQSVNKRKCSILDFLPYSIDELKQHLESLFEPWMTWKNWGKYRLDSWDDNDIKTWKWQIDHIIPQADLPYISMEDENFKKCWALSNLRPISAKLNVIEGVSRIRHKKVFK